MNLLFLFKFNAMHNIPVETGRKIGFVRKNLDKDEISIIFFRNFPETRKYILSLRFFWGKKLQQFLTD